MALARGRRGDTSFNYWPGFVDALSTLVLSIVFLLSVFLVVQFFLSQEVTGKDKALEQLNAKIAQLNDLLSLEKLGKIEPQPAQPVWRNVLRFSPQADEEALVEILVCFAFFQRNLPGVSHRLIAAVEKIVEPRHDYVAFIRLGDKILKSGIAQVIETFCAQRPRVLLDGFGELAGFAVSESGDAGFSILTLDGYRFLFEEMMEWVMHNWQGRVNEQSHFSTEITEHQEWEKKILERSGFRCEQTFFTRRFDLTGDLVPRYPLEPGFTIVDMKTHPDVRAQGVLRANAFWRNEAYLDDASGNWTALAKDAEIEEHRNYELVTNNIVSREVWDQSRAQADALRSTLEADRAAIRTAELQLSYCAIRAPMDARAGTVQVNAGNTVKNNDAVLVTPH